ncbi:tripartite tricarboxylate transporter substrate binding protein [Nonomuraea rhizosphaerae]|uniref:tripartite tricarboxylate transporter substrate binding protein n=1 Tax=Nonomuraea rhizosphaerae TaxID=2665663 RepID=UPI001C5F92EA|nr:tripartite tricarboxylate transporter substrate binding protein [Nonomuraea rhizosphaerae]
MKHALPTILATRVRSAVATLVAVLDLAACGAQGSGGGGQEYPTGQITLIVPFAAGGTATTTARALAPYFERELGRQVIVKNVPGGSGAVGMNELVNAKPDGHTLIVASNSTAVLNPLVNNVGYTKDSYTPVGLFARVPHLLTVPAGSPYKSAADLLEAARQRPGKITIGTSGATTVQSIELKALAKALNVDLKIVPFDGGAGALTALLGGNVDATLSNEDETLPQIEAGKLAAVAVTGGARSAFVPNVPTLEEQGISAPGADSYVSFYGLAAPLKTPPATVSRLERTLRGALSDKAIGDGFTRIKIKPEFQPATAFRTLIDKSDGIYRPITSGHQ